MSILAGDLTRVVFQGLAGTEAEAAARMMMAAGTNLVAGVAAGLGGEEFEGIPVFETVAEAVIGCRASASVVFGPPSVGADSVLEAVDAGLDLVVCTSGPLPLLDAAEVKRALSGGAGPAAVPRAKLVGPGSAGLVTPGECLLGNLRAECFAPGRIGQLGTAPGLMLEAAWQLRREGLGTSTAVDLGSEPVRGLSVAEALTQFRADTDTEAILLTGSVGRQEVDDCARVVAATGKPIAAYLPLTASGEAAALCRSRLSAAGAALIEDPALIGSTVAEILSR